MTQFTLSIILGAVMQVLFFSLFDLFYLDRSIAETRSSLEWFFLHSLKEPLTFEHYKVHALFTVVGVLFYELELERFVFKQFGYNPSSKQIDHKANISRVMKERADKCEGHEIFSDPKVSDNKLVDKFHSLTV